MHSYAGHMPTFTPDLPKKNQRCRPKVTREFTWATLSTFVKAPFVNRGSVPEWLNGPVSKTGIGAILSEVRILPLPQVNKKDGLTVVCMQ